MQEKIHNNDVTGELAAKYYAFYSQKNNKRLSFELPLSRVPYIMLYKQNKNTFDKLCQLFIKNNLDILEYIKFINLKLRKPKETIKIDLLDIYNIQLFIEEQKINLLNRYIYIQLIKSAKYIALQTIKFGYEDCRHFIRYLLKNNKLSNYYVAGKISKYYIAAIPNIKNIILKMDILNKQELEFIYDRYDKYYNDVTVAYEYQTGECLNVFNFTNLIISKILKK